MSALQPLVEFGSEPMTGLIESEDIAVPDNLVATLWNQEPMGLSTPPKKP